MKPGPRCQTCGHPMHLHSREGCWWMKYVAGDWPCKCGQPEDSTEPAIPLDAATKT